MELHYKIIGFMLILLAFIHIIFPNYFNWKDDLKSLSLINRQMMKIHTFFIALTVLLMGLLCLFSTNDLIYSKLGKIISFGFGIFWTIRLLIQIFGYSSELWKGKLFETIIHVLFTIIWIYFSIIFILVSLN